MNYTRFANPWHRNAIDVRVVRKGSRWAVLDAGNVEIFHSRSQSAAWDFVDGLRMGLSREQAAAAARRSLERQVSAER